MLTMKSPPSPFHHYFSPQISGSFTSNVTCDIQLMGGGNGGDGLNDEEEMVSQNTEVVYCKNTGLCVFSQSYLIVDDPSLWWPWTMSDSPGFLYAFQVNVSACDSKGNMATDLYRQPIGIRTVGLEGDKFMINGKQFYFQGFGKHEDADVSSPSFYIHKYIHIKYTYPHTAKMSLKLGFLNYICTCIHIRTHACTHAHTHTHMHTCVHMHVHIHTCIHIHTHACTCVHVHIHTHICMHAHPVGNVITKYHITTFQIRGKGLDYPILMKDMNLLKWLGANSFRTSHYPYAEEMMDLCDKFGIVVVDETPAVGLVK